MATARGGYFVDGIKVPSVTQVIGQLDKPALIPWAAKLNRELLVEPLRKAQEGDIADLVSYHAFLDKTLSEAPTFRTKTASAADAGTLVHDMIEAWLGGSPHTKPLEKVKDEDVRQKALTGFESFLAWTEGYKYEHWHGEIHLVHPEMMFGGTPDSWGIFSGENLGVADWKTGSGIYTEAYLQVAAYAKLVEQKEEREVREAHIVRFSRHSASFVHQKLSYEQIQLAWGVFTLLLDLKENMNLLKEKMK